MLARRMSLILVHLHHVHHHFAHPLVTTATLICLAGRMLTGALMLVVRLGGGLCDSSVSDKKRKRSNHDNNAFHDLAPYLRPSRAVAL